MPSLAGHYWTLAPHLRDNLRRPRAPARDFELAVPDELWGSVRLTGLLDDRPGTRGMLVVVHGLGGHAESVYALRIARAARALGLASLRLNLRGADRRGEDFYHAGLTSDLHAVLQSPEVSRHARVWVLGISLGGHMVLRAATEGLAPAVRAAATVCAPVDLALGAAAIDRPRAWIYRRYVLDGLKEMLREVAERRGDLPIPLELAERIETIREWDDRVVAPRHGFRDAPHYYEAVSVGPKLDAIGVPTLIVAARHDPMVPEDTIRPSLARASSQVDARWADRGGHVGFPSDLDLGVPGPPGLESQVLGWLASHD